MWMVIFFPHLQPLTETKLPFLFSFKCYFGSWKHRRYRTDTKNIKFEMPISNIITDNNFMEEVTFSYIVLRVTKWLMEMEKDRWE